MIINEAFDSESLIDFLVALIRVAGRRHRLIFHKNRAQPAANMYRHSSTCQSESERTC